MVERGRDAAGRIGTANSEHDDESTQSQTADQTTATSAFAAQAHRQSALTAAASHAAETKPGSTTSPNSTTTVSIRNQQTDIAVALRVKELGRYE